MKREIEEIQKILKENSHTIKNIEYIISFFNKETIELSEIDYNLLIQIPNFLLSTEDIDDNKVEDFCNIGEKISKFTNQEQCYEIFEKLRIQFYEENNKIDEALIKLDKLEKKIPNDIFIIETKKRLCDKKEKILSNKSLDEIIDFSEYIDKLKENSEKYIIFIAARDTPYGSGLTQELSQKLKSLGLEADLYGKFRCGYVAIIFRGKKIAESLTHPDKEATCSGNIGDLKIELISRSYNCPPMNSIIKLNDIDYSPNLRGLNFVIYDLHDKKVINQVGFDVFEETLPCKNKNRYTILKYKLSEWCKKHKDIGLICYRYPKFPENNLSECEQYIRDKIKEDNIITFRNVFNYPDMPLRKYFETMEDMLEVIRPPKSYHDINGVRKFEDYIGKNFNAIAGHRITTDQPQNAKRTIYMVGGCGICGHGNSDSNTIPSNLQRLCNEKAFNEQFIVENYGYYLAETDYNGFEEMNILESLPIKSGDIVITDWGLPDDALILDLSNESKRPHNHGELLFDRDHPCANGCHFIAEKIFDFLKQHNFFSNLKTNQQILENKKSFNELNNKQNELLEYKKKLCTLYENQFSVGAIVMNCNPFTLGHRYLIEQAARKIGHLIIFVVEENKSIFPFEDRLRLVQEGTSDLKNVVVYPSGQFILSSLTFSEYFNKSELQNRVVNPSIDIELFAKEIAPCLHITKRFVGTEPCDTVTQQYNNEMKKVLPKYGIELIEIERLKQKNSLDVISASQVRNYIKQQNIDKLKDIVPNTTYKYILDNLDKLNLT